MAKICAPNKQYTGISAGVMFVNGVGETSDPHLIKWFQERGYQVVEDALEEKQLVEEQPPVKGGRKNGKRRKARKTEIDTRDSGG